jgi:type II secretory pathway pseudopilin PulG
MTNLQQFRDVLADLKPEVKNKIYQLLVAGPGKASDQIIEICSENGVVISDQEIDTFRREMDESGELNDLELSLKSLTNVAGGISNPAEKVNRKILPVGFTMVEVIIAGLLMASAMTAFARLAISSMQASSNQLERTRIEAAINDNIQLIQRADSLLTYESIGQGDVNQNDQQLEACDNPALHLQQQLEDENGSLFIEPPQLTDASNNMLINRTIDANSIPGIAIITFDFIKPPESNISAESRVLEISPNFQSSCF